MMTRTMRRFKQQLPPDEVEIILRNGKYFKVTHPAKMKDMPTDL